MDKMTLHPIGVVASPLKSLADCPLQGSEGAPRASIKIYPQYLDALKGLSVGNSIMLLTWLHAANRDVLQCYPRNEISQPHIGVFATRSPDRPNPIGYHEVGIVSISNEAIVVEPLEVLDGTPVLDIKPVI